MFLDFLKHFKKVMIDCGLCLAYKPAKSAYIVSPEAAYPRRLRTDESGFE
jgi:hypothetical protein